MTQNIDALLREWEYIPGPPQARRATAPNGREVLLMRVELGILQMEPRGRPDGARPHNFPTYFDYLKQEVRKDSNGEEGFRLNEEQSQEADREFYQFYQRRICWLALHDYGRAVADSDHTLAFMDFISRHSAEKDYVQAHEQYRGFVLFHRTQAAIALALEKNNPERAIDEIAHGLHKMREFFSGFGVEDQMEEDSMVQQLRKTERSLRKTHNIGTTLQEQLNQAIANEEYEAAAKLRDALLQQKERPVSEAKSGKRPEPSSGDESVPGKGPRGKRNRGKSEAEE